MIQTSTAHAQIGWTLDQCKKWLGQGTTSDNIIYQFAAPPKSDYIITVEMRNGVVESAQYDPAHVTEKDAYDTLVENSNGYIWTKTGEKGSGYGKVTYFSAHIDGKIGMTAILRKGSLGIFAADYVSNY
jgi:hypothetical protein